ncbi:MAG: VWA domain-containing protein [Armatimonadetes bacterium]|nr:VWA domain-containing protein [Armatimonadota bacterium]
MADSDTTRIGSPDPDRTRLADVDRTRLADPDRTRMAAPPGAAPRALTLTATSGNTYALSSDTTREHLLLEIGATGQGGGARLPLNIALCIDRSGSMDGDPLEYAKRACGYVVDLLEPNDILSVVTFEDHADVIMPARRVVNKPLVKDYINRIGIGNTTNLYEGLVTACQQVASVKSENTLNRVLLLTDGEPTAGTKDFQSIVGQVAEQKGRGISVTALGFGPDYNEELAAGIARRSGGNYYYIARPELIPEVFRRELDSLMRITARNLRLRVTVPRGVVVRQVYGQTPTFGPRTAEVALIDVERESGLSSVWELELSPRPAGTYRVAQAELVYDDAATGRLERLTADAVMDFTTDRSAVAAGVNARVQAQVEIARAARALDKTMLNMRTQRMDVTQAMQELNRTKTLMLDQGRLAQAQQITQAIQDIQGGGSVEKTLIGTIYALDQGKTR